MKGTGRCSTMGTTHEAREDTRKDLEIGARGRHGGARRAAGRRGDGLQRRGDRRGQSPPPVRIGAIYNISGDQAPLDAPSLNGARLAVDRINAHGGLMGRRVELLERDGQTNKTDVERAAASLVASGCSAIIGLSDTDQVLAAAPIAARAGVPFVTSGATSPKLAEEVPNWLFLACFGDNAQAAAGAQYATEHLGARTATVLYDPDLQYTRLLAKYFERSFRAQGGTILAAWPSPTVAAPSSAPPTRPPRRRRRQRLRVASGKLPTSPAEADVLYVAVPPDDAPATVRMLRRMGARQPIMGGDSYDTPELIAAAEQTGGKVYYTTHAGIEMSEASRAVRRFDASYESTYGLPPPERVRRAGLRRHRPRGRRHQTRRLGQALEGARRADEDAPLPRRHRHAQLRGQ